MIITAIRNKADVYNVGDIRTINMGSFGTQTIRIANKSTPSECSDSDFSQTACGYVFEFVDSIDKHIISYYNQVDMDEYLDTTVYNALPETLKNAIVNTKVVTGHGQNSQSNTISYKKIYMLSPHEVWEDVDNDPYSGISILDSSYDNSRQLDYYNNLEVTSSSYSGAIKQYNGVNDNWWLRGEFSSLIAVYFSVNSDGSYYGAGSQNQKGVSPAFKIA